MTIDQAKTYLTIAVLTVIALITGIVKMSEYINWTYVGLYFMIGIPVLLLMCRGIDTAASELNDINPK